MRRRRSHALFPAFDRRARAPLELCNRHVHQRLVHGHHRPLLEVLLPHQRPQPGGRRYAAGSSRRPRSAPHAPADAQQRHEQRRCTRVIHLPTSHRHNHPAAARGSSTPHRARHSDGAIQLADPRVAHGRREAAPRVVGGRLRDGRPPPPICIDRRHRRAAPSASSSMMAVGRRDIPLQCPSSGLGSSAMRCMREECSLMHRLLRRVTNGSSDMMSAMQTVPTTPPKRQR